jgi:hypothetical protein
LSPPGSAGGPAGPRPATRPPPGWRSPRSAGAGAGTAGRCRPSRRRRHDVLHRAGRQAAPRGSEPGEHMPVQGVRRPPVPEPGRDRLAGARRERHPVLAAALVVHRDQAGMPVQVVQGQGRDLAGPQAEPGQEHDDGVIPPPGSRGTVAAAQQRGHRLRARRRPPAGPAAAGNMRDRVRQRPGDETADVHEPQQRPQRRRGIPGRVRGLLPGGPDHERGHVRPGQRCRDGKAPGQERPGIPQVAGAGARCQAPLAGQVAVPLVQEFRGRPLRDGLSRERHGADPAQVSQQRAERLHADVLLALAGLPARQELRGGVLGQDGQADALRMTAQLSGQPQLGGR